MEKSRLNAPIPDAQNKREEQALTPSAQTLPDYAPPSAVSQGDHANKVQAITQSLDAQNNSTVKAINDMSSVANTTDDPVLGLKPETISPTATASDSSKVPEDHPANIAQNTISPSSQQPSNTTHPLFQSTEIGTKTARKENPFEKQNERTRQNEKKRKERHRIAIIIGAIVMAIIIVIASVAIWLLITKKPDSQQQPQENEEDITGEIDPVVQASNDWYSLAVAKDESVDGDGDEKADLSVLGKEADFADSGKDVLEIALDQAKTDDEKMGIKFAQMYYACANEDYETARDIADTVQPDDMNIEQQIAYYNIIMDFEGELGNKQRMEEAYAKITELAYIAGGVGSPYEESEGEN